MVVQLVGQGKHQALVCYALGLRVAYFDLLSIFIVDGSLRIWCLERLIFTLSLFGGLSPMETFHATSLLLVAVALFDH